MGKGGAGYNGGGSGTGYGGAGYGGKGGAGYAGGSTYGGKGGAMQGNYPLGMMNGGGKLPYDAKSMGNNYGTFMTYLEGQGMDGKPMKMMFVYQGNLNELLALMGGGAPGANYPGGKSIDSLANGMYNPAGQNGMDMYGPGMGGPGMSNYNPLQPSDLEKKMGTPAYDGAKQPAGQNPAAASNPQTSLMAQAPQKRYETLRGQGVAEKKN